MKVLLQHLSLLLLLFMPHVLTAGPVDEAEARRQAEEFLQQRGRSWTDGVRSAVSHRRAQSEPSQNDYYVFNIGSDDGFVIVSGDDRTTAILGYADSGTINLDDMPDGLRYLLDGYAEQLQWLDAHPSATSSPLLKAQQAPRVAIAPLITTRWSQGAPYNAQCPSISNTRTVTGCVATAYAQVMNYHQWPKAPTAAIPAYTTTTKDKDKNQYQLSVSALPATTFAWDQMANSYSTSDKGPSADAVATLMRYCGSAVQMMYGLSANGGSGAYSESVADALKSTFGYDQGVRFAYRNRYTYLDWVNLAYSELAASRPVLLGGQSMGGGHAFVCDGYQGDDYFHINWGWGGQSDGYFRLSLLNPEEQGLGGSSSLDGFSYGQNMVYGIRPPVAGSTGYCLSLEKLCLGGQGESTLSSTTINRSQYYRSFSFNLAYTLYSYKYGDNTFDYAVQLVNDQGTVVRTLKWGLNQTLSWNGSIQETNASMTIPSSVLNGTYTIKIMSRPSGNSDWQECFHGDRYQLTAVIANDQLTLTIPQAASTKPTLTDMRVDGNLTQGYEQQVTATLKGGSSGYHGQIFLAVDNQAVMGKIVEIPAGETVDVLFSFIPVKSGSTKLSVGTNKSFSDTSYLIGERNFTIQASDASDTQNIGVSYEIVNVTSERKVYGNGLRIQVKVTNPSNTNSFVSTVNCSLRKYNSSGDAADKFVSADVQTQSVDVPVNGTQEYTLVYSGVEAGKYYRLRFSYTQGYTEDGKLKHRTVDAGLSKLYEMVEGYATCKADGTVGFHPMSTTILSGDADYVDLTAISSFSGIEVTSSTNPNCLYLLADGVTIPDALADKNVVCGTTAPAISLSDDHDFYSPKAFTAQTISYTHVFEADANAKTSGWTTLLLPFTATSVTCDQVEVDWFRSASDEGKNFWLREFAGDESSHVLFDYVAGNELTANKPYLIAVPGGSWGKEWDMTNRPVVFSATDADVLPTTSMGVVSGDHFKFCGATNSSTLTDAYMLNDAGTRFVKTSTADLSPFRACFLPVSLSSLNIAALTIASPGTTALQPIVSDVQAEQPALWHTLDGRRLSTAPVSPGIYLYQGKKIVVK